MTFTWAIAGFGEVGEVLVADDVLGPAQPVVLLPDSRPISEATQKRLRKAGIKPVRELASVRDIDVVISVVTPASALEIARTLAPHLKPNAFYVDVNSISGSTARAIAEMVTSRPARFVDAAFLGAVPLLRAAVPIYLSGKDAPGLAGLLGPFGLRPTIVSDRDGDASDLKMLWGVMSKGAIGLVAETLTAAERIGLTAPIVRLLAEEFGRTGSVEMLHRMLESTARTGERRLDELAAISQTLASAQVPPFMTDAAAKWISLLSQTGSARGAPDLKSVIKATVADVMAAQL